MYILSSTTIKLSPLLQAICYFHHCPGPTASTGAAPRAARSEPRRVAHGAGSGPLALQPLAPRGGAREERGADGMPLGEFFLIYKWDVSIFTIVQ